MQCPILAPSWLGAVLFLLVSDGRGSGGGGGGGGGKVTVVIVPWIRKKRTSDSVL